MEFHPHPLSYLISSFIGASFLQSPWLPIVMIVVGWHLFVFGLFLPPSVLMDVSEFRGFYPLLTLLSAVAGSLVKVKSDPPWKMLLPLLAVISGEILGPWAALITVMITSWFCFSPFFSGFLMVACFLEGWSETVVGTSNFFLLFVLDFVACLVMKTRQ